MTDLQRADVVINILTDKKPIYSLARCHRAKLLAGKGVGKRSTLNVVA